MAELSAHDVLAAVPLADRLRLIDELQGKRGLVMAQLARERDAAYMAARAVYPGPKANAATRLESDLNGYSAGAWSGESHIGRLPKDASEIHRTLHRIMRHSNGRPPLRWRRIVDVWPV
jgi:hypothetical protein